ncbi:SHOCT domain-containing protein [Nocardia sp. NBC_01377]|uniref:SHOCT domain-containing protein n=1 Tax=Nocardia sp. NBC_01377 TaxID=2903595 RepID=UPI00324C203A
MPGLLRGVARTAAIAGTATAVSNRVSRRQGQRWSQQAPAPQQAPPPPPPQAAPTTDPLEALQRLGELKAQGVLDENEFNAMKAKILAS